MSNSSNSSSLSGSGWLDAKEGKFAWVRVFFGTASQTRSSASSRSGLSRKSNICGSGTCRAIVRGSGICGSVSQVFGEDSKRTSSTGDCPRDESGIAVRKTGEPKNSFVVNDL